VIASPSRYCISVQIQGKPKYLGRLPGTSHEILNVHQVECATGGNASGELNLAIWNKIQDFSLVGQLNGSGEAHHGP
jgi:hypothetical protein